MIAADICQASRAGREGVVVRACRYFSGGADVEDLGADSGEDIGVAASRRPLVQ